MTPHQFLKDIYTDFCSKHNMVKRDGHYLSADDYLSLQNHEMFIPEKDIYETITLTAYQVQWLTNYIKHWEYTNGGEDIDE